MTQPNDTRALYQQWLEIPPERMPPNHYAILGLSDFESDASAIEAAAKSRAAYLHQIAAGPNRKVVQDMLGQVATARRVLLDEVKKDDYDRSLRNPKVSATPAGSSTEHASSNGSKRKSDWKYHAASAAALLLIVLCVYLYNLGGGGRKAAEARPGAVESSSSDSDEAPNETSSGSRAAAKLRSTTRKANEQPEIAATRPRPRPRPMQGGGLQLNSDKFADVLSNIEKETSEAVAEKRKEGNQAADKSSFSVEMDDAISAGEYPQQLTQLSSFPSVPAEQFESSRGWDWLDQSGGKAKVQSSDQAKEVLFHSSESSFGPNSGRAIAWSIPNGLPADARLGAAIEGIGVLVRSTDDGLQLFVRERKKGEQPKNLVVLPAKIEKLRLAFVRSQADPNQLSFFADADGKMFGGTITLKQPLPQEAKLSWLLKPSKDFADQTAEILGIVDGNAD